MTQILTTHATCSISSDDCNKRCEDQGLPGLIQDGVFGGCTCHCDCLYYQSNPTACESKCWAIGKRHTITDIGGCLHCQCTCPPADDCSNFCQSQGKTVAAGQGSSDCACQCADTPTSTLSPTPTTCAPYDADSCHAKCQDEGKTAVIKQVKGCFVCDCQCALFDSTFCQTQCQNNGMIPGSQLSIHGCRTCICQPTQSPITCAPYDANTCRAKCQQEGKTATVKYVKGCPECDCQCASFDFTSCQSQCQYNGMVVESQLNNHGCRICICQHTPLSSFPDNIIITTPSGGNVPIQDTDQTTTSESDTSRNDDKPNHESSNEETPSGKQQKKNTLIGISFKFKTLAPW